MQALIKPLLTYLIYPLAKEAAQWIYDKYIKKKSDDKRAEYKKKRLALKRAIKESKNDEDIKSLSIILHELG